MFFFDFLKKFAINLRRTLRQIFLVVRLQLVGIDHSAWVLLGHVGWNAHVFDLNNDIINPLLHRTGPSVELVQRHHVDRFVLALGGGYLVLR